MCYVASRLHDTEARARDPGPGPDLVDPNEGHSGMSAVHTRYVNSVADSVTTMFALVHSRPGLPMKIEIPLSSTQVANKDLKM